MKLTIKEMETMQRALGLIEGATCALPKEVQEVLITAIEMIDGLIEEGADNGLLYRAGIGSGKMP